ncbi:MAG: hypothetical protein ABIG66_03640 [Candidatus Kerfeldbacteria bacterium]
MKKALLCVISVIVVFLVGVSSVSAAGLPAPTLFAPEHGSFTTSSLPVITGVAPAGMRIAVYIDDTFNGYATTVSEANGTQSFAYTPFLALNPGTHYLKARTENVETGVRSDVCDTQMFTIEYHIPAPTILDTVINEESSWDQPWIVGLATSGAEVVVWIDGKLDGTVKATTDASGVGNFAYKPSFKLTSGSHAFTAIAQAKRGNGTLKSSLTSDAFTTSVYDPSLYVAQTVTEVEQTEEAQPEEQAEESQEANQEEEPKTNEEVEAEVEEALGDTGTLEEEEISDEESGGEEASEEEAMSSEEGGSEGEGSEGEGGEAAGEEENNTLTFLGWLTLLVVAVIVVTRIRKRRDNAGSGPSFTPGSGDSGDTSDDGQQQLELKGSDENKNIEVIKKGPKDNN